MKKDTTTRTKETRIYFGCLLVLPFLVLFSVLSHQGYSIPARFLPPCLFHTLTGFSCPGCGCTRAVISLMQGDLIKSFCYNPGVLYCALLYLLFVLSHTAAYISAMIKKVRLKNAHLPKTLRVFRSAQGKLSYKTKELPSRLRESRQRERSLLCLLNRIHGMKIQPIYFYILIWLFLGFGILRFFVELWQRFH